MSWLSSGLRKLGGALGIGDKKVTTSTALDPGSQKYVDAMRLQAQRGANTIMGGPGGAGPYMPSTGAGANWGMPTNGMGGSWFTGPQTQSIGDQAAAFFNPYQQQVIGGLRGEFDHLRGMAEMGANQQATLGGAFGGSRHGVMAGTRLGELDRAEASQIGGLLHSGYQNALSQGTAYAEQQRQLQQQQMMEPIWRAQMAQGMYQGGMGPTGSTSTSTQPGGGLLGAIGGIGMVAGGLGWSPFGGGQQAPASFSMPQQWQPPQFGMQYRSPWG